MALGLEGGKDTNRPRNFAAKPWPVRATIDLEAFGGY
jgi:hypothetical protein